MLALVDLIPADDAARLQALVPFQELLARPDVVFDAFVELTALAFNAPVAMLSFVDADSVWMKALYGLSEPRRVPRAQSLCSVTILGEATTVMHDLSEAALPASMTDLLNEMLQLRFYAGHPLQTPQGYNIGVLGIAGRTARIFDEAHQQRLRALTALAMQLLQLRLTISHSRFKPSPAWILFHDELTQCMGQLHHSDAGTSTRLEQIDTIIELLQRDLDHVNTTAH